MHYHAWLQANENSVYFQPLTFSVKSKLDQLKPSILAKHTTSPCQKNTLVLFKASVPLEVKSSLSLCSCKLSFDMRFEAIEAVLRELAFIYIFLFFPSTWHVNHYCPSLTFGLAPILLFMYTLNFGVPGVHRYSMGTSIHRVLYHETDNKKNSHFFTISNDYYNAFFILCMFF